MKNTVFALSLIAALAIGYLFGEFKNRKTSSLTPDPGMAENFLMDSLEIARTHGIFKKYTATVNGGKPDTTLTRFISFDRSSFVAMGNFFNDSANKDIAGVRCFMIRYDSLYTQPGGGGKPGYEIRGKIAKEQNSVVFLPYDNKNRTLYNRWPKKSSVKKDGYNHGDICPEDCYGESKK